MVAFVWRAVGDEEVTAAGRHVKAGGRCSESSALQIYAGFIAFTVIHKEAKIAFFYFINVVFIRLESICTSVLSTVSLGRT